MKTALFCVITERVVVNYSDVSGQPIGPIRSVQESKIESKRILDS